MKKIGTILVAMMLVFGMAACGSEPEVTQLGTSGFYITLPEGYEACEDDFDEDQVAYFYKDDESIDLDVYQWSKDGQYTLGTEAEYFSAAYGTTAETVVINEISGLKYVTEEEYDGYEYTVLNYMFDDGDHIVEVCFWTINTPEEISAAEEIISTITTEN